MNAEDPRSLALTVSEIRPSEISTNVESDWPEKPMSTVGALLLGDDLELPQNFYSGYTRTSAALAGRGIDPTVDAENFVGPVPGIKKLRAVKVGSGDRKSARTLSFSTEKKIFRRGGVRSSLGSKRAPKSILRRGKIWILGRFLFFSKIFGGGGGAPTAPPRPGSGSK
jgi:hypothetical protein